MANHSIRFYGLSTCIHCRHTREFLEKEHVAFDLVYVDQLHGSERDDAIEKVRYFNPRLSFPTVVVDDGKEVVVGFQPEKLKEVLEL